MDSKISEIISNYCKTKPVLRAWVFGSFSRGEEREDSDIDILVELMPGTMMGLGFCEMICDLEDSLQRPVDLVRKGCILPFARESIDHDKILIYERAS